MKKAKNKRKRFDIVYIIISIVFWMLFAVAAYYYTKHSAEWMIVVASLALIAWIVYTLVFAFKHWSWFISDLINAYKKQHDLFSGGFALVMLFLTLIFITNSFNSMDVPETYVSLINTLPSFFIAAMSAMIGLMGVQYTIAIQERNRKEDLRRASKPYFVVEAYLVDCIPGGNKHSFRKIKIGLHIHNISGNIGIPLAVQSLDATDCSVTLDYHPLPHNGELKECVKIHSDTPYRSAARIALCYKDAYDNNYKMHIEFDLHKDANLSNTRVLCDEYVSD